MPNNRYVNTLLFNKDVLSLQWIFIDELMSFCRNSLFFTLAADNHQ